MRHPRRLPGAPLLLAAALAPVGSPPAPADAQVALTWTPRDSSTTQFLFGVACPTATDCFGTGQGSGNVGSAPLIQHWDGAAWSIQRTPVIPGSFGDLGGISCTSATACTTVGEFGTRNGGGTLAERWNGTSWSVQRTPKTGLQNSFLSTVSCASPNSCVAVGGGGNSPSVPLAETWNGTTWSIRATVADGPGDSLPLLHAVREQMALAVELGHGDEDMAATYLAAARDA